MMKNTTRHPDYFRQVSLFFLLMLLSVIVLAQANPILKLPQRDNGTYLYSGSQILKGKLPYRDAWESKPPAIFYVNALGLYIGKGSRLGVWLLEFVTIMSAAYLGYTILQKLWGNRPALFGTLMWLYGLYKTLEGGNLTEEYSLPFIFLGMLAFLFSLEKPGKRWPDFLVGVTFAISFLFRPNNAMTQAAIVMTQILLCLVKRQYKLMFLRLGTMAAGAFMTIAIPVLYFWQNDLLLELYDATIAFNITYSETQIVSRLNPLQAGFLLLGASAWIALFGFILSFVQAVLSFRRDKSLDAITLFMLIGWLAVIPFSDPAHRCYAHYYMNWLPLVALSNGALFSVAQGKVFSKFRFGANNQGWDAWITLLLAVLILISGKTGTSYLRSFEQVSKRQGLIAGRRSMLALYVNNHTAPGELVYFWGGYPGENFMSQRDAPTPYLYYPLYLESDLSTRINDAFLQTMIDNKPVLIVDMNYARALSFDPEIRAAQLASGIDLSHLPENLENVYQFIEENYYLETVVDNRKIYRLYGTVQR